MSETNSTPAVQTPEPSSSPKLFVSYAWSSAEHEQWVLDLAERLVENGVDVILDKWDLQPGHDANAFMERMVTDGSVTKVVMVSDQKYAQKADARTSGGVSTETQIISREVYERQDQSKFVAILTEKDVDGKPFLPTYYKSRVYVDFSDSSLYDESFDKLLRWIYNKPRHVRPELGKPPALLLEESRVRLGAGPLFAQLGSTKQQESPTGSPAVRIGRAGKVRMDDNYLPGFASLYDSDETDDFEANRNRTD